MKNENMEEFLKEELKEPEHKGESKKQVVREEFGTEGRAAKVAKMLKAKQKSKK